MQLVTTAPRARAVPGANDVEPFERIHQRVQGIGYAVHLAFARRPASLLRSSISSKIYEPPNCSMRKWGGSLRNCEPGVISRAEIRVSFHSLLSSATPGRH